MKTIIKLLEKLTTIVKKAPPDVRTRLIVIFTFLTVFNGGVWLLVLIASHTSAVLLGLASLAYGFGLRHGVDADHIAVIDNTTRKLMHDGKRPVAVGLFFSLGHSTIVVLLSLLVAISAAFVHNNLPAFKETGSLIGTLVSSSFLIIIGIINLIVLIDIFKIWRKVLRGAAYDDVILTEHLYNRGMLTRLFGPILKTVNQSWHMYFVGFLFGLGFDTASEVGLLSISAVSGAKGMPVWEIMLLPFAFTAGMSLVDTLDGILMLGAYGWAYVKPIRKLYYNMNITLISVIIALFIGGVEGLQIISAQTKIHTGILGLANNIALENLGYIIIAAFLASWLLSIAIYKLNRYDLLDSKHNIVS